MITVLIAVLAITIAGIALRAHQKASKNLVAQPIPIEQTPRKIRRGQ